MATENKMATRLKENAQSLTLQLAAGIELDVDVFSKMEGDEYALGALLVDQEKRILQYSLEEMVSLEAFLDQYSFEGEEGYLFLQMLFERAAACNRNKPVLFLPEFVYVSGYGDEIKFVVLPLHISEWMYQKDQILAWCEWICRHFKTSSAYEIPGFIQSFMKSPDFSLGTLLSGLIQLRQQYYPKKWYKPGLKAFTAKEKVTRKVQNNFFGSDFNVEENHLEYEGLFEEKKDFESRRTFEPLEAKRAKDKFIDMEEKTQLIGSPEVCQARLEMGNEVYPLVLEDMTVGRGIQCQIRLNDSSVSIVHARITCDQGRYYIQDLKSSNHTWLGSKQVVRKMRLRPGMSVRFGSTELIYKE